MINDAPRNATVIAQEPCILYSLGKEDFQAVIGESEMFEDELRSVIFSRR